MPPSGLKQRTMAIAAGSMAGIGLLVAHIAYASYIFSGSLTPYVSYGITFVILGVFTGCILIAVFGSVKGAISGLSPSLVVVMAVVAESMPGTGETLFQTTVAAFVICVCLTGGICYCIGRFQLANYVRFIPFPVSAGFVSGIGATVCIAAISMSMPIEKNELLRSLIDFSHLVYWLPGLAYGVGLYFALKKWGNPLILPVSAVLLIVVYQLAFGGLDISSEVSRQKGFYIAASGVGLHGPAIAVLDFGQINWSDLYSQIPNLLVFSIVSLICIVMSLAGLELALKEDLDWNKEFRVAGASSVVSGAVGGSLICMIVPATYRNKLLGAMTRRTGVICAVVIGSALFFGEFILTYVPIALISGILVFAGLGLIEEGLVRGVKRLPWSEYSIVVLIFLVIAIVGFIEGIVVGMIAMLIFFAIRLSNVDPIETQFTGNDTNSNKVRPPPDLAILMERGRLIQAFRLRGYLFFGSTWTLISHMKKTMLDDETSKSLILDFKNVSGFDYSAVNALAMFLQHMIERGVKVVLSGAPKPFLDGLAMQVPQASFSELNFVDSEDLALETCESELIEEWHREAEDTPSSRSSLLSQSVDELEKFIDRQVVFEQLLGSLKTWSKIRSYEAQERIKDSEHIQILKTGEITLLNASDARLLQRSIGDIVTPLAMIHPDATKIVADMNCEVVVIERSTLQWLEEHEQEHATKLYSYLFLLSN